MRCGAAASRADRWTIGSDSKNTVRDPSPFAGSVPIAGYVLAGGRSRRFGSDKRLADWRGETFLAAVVRLLREAGCDDVCAVQSSEQDELPGDWRTIADDGGTDRHPMHGVRAALAAAQAATQPFLAIVAVDQPFLRPQWLRDLRDIGGGVFADTRESRQTRGALQPFPLVMATEHAATAGELAENAESPTRWVRRLLAAGRLHPRSLPKRWPPWGSINRTRDLLE